MDNVVSQCDLGHAAAGQAATDPQIDYVHSRAVRHARSKFLEVVKVAAMIFVTYEQ